jgi:hypothetical protein
MLILRLCTLVGIVALAAVAGIASNAFAQANCATYGKLALQQQQQNAEAKCGFSGPEWSSDLQAHINWCGGVGPDQWRAQLQKRQQLLDACKAK